MAKGGDSYQVVYVDGDVPQLPIQLGQLLVDSSEIDSGTTNLQQCTSQSPLIYLPVTGAFGRTAAEVLAGVTVVNYYYPEGRVDRYGNNTVPGTTDMRAAFDAAYLVFKNGGTPPWGVGTYRLNKNGANVYALRWDSDVVLNGHGAMTLVGDGAQEYTLLYITGGSNVHVDVSGTTFDGALTGYTPAATNSIGIRQGSSVDRYNVANCHFTRFSSAAVYFAAQVPGKGGFIRDCTLDDIGHSGIGLAFGEKLTLSKVIAKNVQLQPFNLSTNNVTDILRNIDVVDCHVFGGGDYGGAFATTDRAAYAVIGRPTAASTDQGNIRLVNCSTHDYGLSAPGTVPLVLGVETRDIYRPLVTGHLSTGVRNIGLYSYRTVNALFQGCVATGNDVGLAMNNCTDYAEIGNSCYGNTTADRDYFGTDAPSTYLQADGLNTVLARGSVTFPAGVPTLANAEWNVTVDADVGTGHTRFAFINDASANARYSVEVTLSGSSAATGTYRTNTHTATTFNIETFTAGVAADEPYDFVVIGLPANTVEPN